MTILLTEILIIIIAILYCFFGYRLARFLLPICSAALGFGLLNVLVPEYFSFAGAQQIIVSVCCIISIYVLLFMLKRAGALITGLLAATLVCFSIVEISRVSAYEIVSPIILTVCLTAGLLCFVYQRTAGIAATSVLGGFLASLFGISIINGGIKAAGLSEFIRAMAAFFSTNALVISLVALGLCAAGILFQLFVSGRKTILPSWKEKQHQHKSTTKQGTGNRNTFV